jgi:hypothetical protein
VTVPVASADALPEHGEPTQTGITTPPDSNLLSSSPSEEEEDIIAQNDSKSIKCSEDLAAKVIHTLEQLDTSATGRDKIIAWILPNALDLAHSKGGTRVIQKAMDGASNQQLTLFVQRFQGHVPALLMCPNGNRVLDKAIEQGHGNSWSTQIIWQEMAVYPGWSEAANHSFAYRVVQRLIEHCNQAREAIVKTMISERKASWVTDWYANYVTQSVSEHGTPEEKLAIIQRLLDPLGVPSLCKHGVASHVVENAWDQGDDKCKQALLMTILRHNGALADLARDYLGSKTVKRIVDAKEALTESLHAAAMWQLVNNAAWLQDSKRKKHGKKFALIAYAWFNSQQAMANNSLPKAIGLQSEKSTLEVQSNSGDESTQAATQSTASD